MKTIDVVAAVIYKDDRIFVTQRGYGEYKDFWEFPGGKIEEGEAPADALIREIREELDTLIEPVKLIDRVEYDYPSFHLSMRCYASSFWSMRTQSGLQGSSWTAWDSFLRTGSLWTAYSETGTSILTDVIFNAGRGM